MTSNPETLHFEQLQPLDGRQSVEQHNTVIGRWPQTQKHSILNNYNHRSNPKKLQTTATLTELQMEFMDMESMNVEFLPYELFNTLFLSTVEVGRQTPQ